jgi:hypothetical protein
MGAIVRVSLPYRAVAAIVLGVAVVGGCSTPGTSKSTSVTYSFDPGFSFPDAKTYAWQTSKVSYGSNALVDANVRFLADRNFQAKGLSPAADKPALRAWVGSEADYYGGYYGSGSGYELRVLTLNLARADDNVLVWQGRALGSIRTDAASGDLKKVVDEMLANFPPK